MIRKAHSDDVSSFIALQSRVQEGAEIWGYGADSESTWSERNLAWSFVAANEGEIVGFIYCAPRTYSGECVFPAGSRILEIQELVVHPEHREHGYGLAASSQRSRASCTGRLLASARVFRREAFRRHSSLLSKLRVYPLVLGIDAAHRVLNRCQSTSGCDP